MSDVERRFHEAWLGHVQPIDGLVVSVPVLVDAQCMARQAPGVQARLRDLTIEVDSPDECVDDEGAGGTAVTTLTRTRRRIADLPTFFAEILDLTPDLFDTGDAVERDISLYVPEGRQTIRPTMGLRRLDRRDDQSRYVALVWALPDGLDPDINETETGPWRYPASSKFERLLRHVRVPIGLLTNGEMIRLVYAPYGESTGAITFRVADMAEVWGRPVLDAFVMLLSAHRFFGVTPERQLPALLQESRTRQADVTEQLAAQVLEALTTLLTGFEAAAIRDGSDALDDALERGNDHLYGGLLTTLLRLVFVLYAEDRGLLPVESDFYEEHLSVLALYDRLQIDRGSYPDSMDQRFGAWGRLIMLFRTIFLGASHGDFLVPARRGELFDPHRFPFLEGWRGASAPISDPDLRAEVVLPSIDDLAVLDVIERLLVLDGQRLSYKALDVEQIGSVYEALMGYHVVRLTSPAVCIGPKRVWVSVSDVRKQRPAALAKWLKSETGLTTAKADELAKTLRKPIQQADDDAIIVALDGCRIKGTARVAAGRLVLQPGAERRRTSSHYTPRSLSGPIVERTLEPLLKAMGEAPSADAILELKVCDPAMGSGAFLVETCRFLATQLEAAWTREGRIDEITAKHESVTNHARRLVAQRCLYGVDRNAFAVSLAKLSLWLETLSRDMPFTFLDHCLRHGDSLVGLSFEDVRAFHWSPKERRATKSQQQELAGQTSAFQSALEVALQDAIAIREEILGLAGDETLGTEREKARLLQDADDAMSRVRLVADLIVGAFFSSTKPKDREAERARRERLVASWLVGDGSPPSELWELQQEIRRRLPVFHWMLEFPEVFQVGRMDPLATPVTSPREEPPRAMSMTRVDGNAQAAPAFLDAIVGNPPFLGGKRISTTYGDEYAAWLLMLHHAGRNGDLVAHFFRRSATLLGDHGTIGLIATNTVAQGDTRESGLRPLIAESGFEIFYAIRSMAWPVRGAAVTIAVVHLAKGTPSHVGVEKVLDGIPVPAISSRLRGSPERLDPVALAENRQLSFQGSIVLGMGFVLTPEEREASIIRDPRNAERIFPYLGGEEVNTSPTQSFHRYVINFGDMSMEDAQRWPDLIAVLHAKVKPERAAKSLAVASWPWWQHWRTRAELYRAITPLERCLVTSRVSKHLMFSFQSTDVILAESLFVFPLDTHTAFAVLQSRIHEAWARLLSSSLEDRLRYAASDCFENFPFPEPDPRTVITTLESVGKRLYDTRAAFMVDTDQGLTKTYNALKDPTVADSRVRELRDLHLELDRAVLTAYGWEDIEVPAFTTAESDEERQAVSAFEDAVIDRLFVLNAARAGGKDR